MSAILCIALNPALDVASAVDHVEPTRKMRTHDATFYPGGGGVNVARAIVELGGTADLIYVSGGETGMMLDRLLGDLPIACERLAATAPTRVSYTVHEDVTGFEYRFVPDGFEIDPLPLERVLQAVRESRYDYVVGSGSLPPGLPDDSYSRIADACEAAGSRFVLDTSGEALRHPLYSSHVFMVKPSLGELKRLTAVEGDDAATERSAMRIVNRRTAENVVVSMGAEGAMLVREDGTLRLPAHHVAVLSAVGAGDSFVGAMVFALASGKTLEDAFTWGVAAGASAVATPGTALCERAAVEEIIAAMRDRQAA